MQKNQSFLEKELAIAIHNYSIFKWDPSIHNQFLQFLMDNEILKQEQFDAEVAKLNDDKITIARTMYSKQYPRETLNKGLKCRELYKYDFLKLIADGLL